MRWSPNAMAVAPTIAVCTKSRRVTVGPGVSMPSTPFESTRVSGGSSFEASAAKGHWAASYPTSRRGQPGPLTRGDAIIHIRASKVGRHSEPEARNNVIPATRTRARRAGCAFGRRRGARASGSGTRESRVGRDPRAAPDTVRLRRVGDGAPGSPDRRHDDQSRASRRRDSRGAADCHTGQPPVLDGTTFQCRAAERDGTLGAAARRRSIESRA